MSLTDKQYSFCVSESLNYSSRAAYISDIALSSVWGDAIDAEIPASRLEALGGIYDACRRSVRDIVAAAGLSQRKFAEHFCIPLRTIENWCAGQRECPIYIRLMMQEALGLFRRE